MTIKTQKKPGRPPALTGDLAFMVAYALGHGVDLRDVSAAAGVSSSTVLRFANAGTLADDPRCQAVLRLVAEHAGRPAEAETQNPIDSSMECDAF